MKQKVTLSDLSKRTGLSQATISMILARRSDVSFSEKTIELVRKAAKELGYAAVTRKKITLFSRRTIMVVCPLILNHYYSAVVQSLQSAAAEMQCNVLVYTTYNNPEEEARLLKVMAESDVGGIIFAMMPQSRSLLRKISKTIPIVIIADREESQPLDFIELHNYQAGCLVGSHLAGLGHKNIVCLSTPLSDAFPARMKRFEGLRETWAKLCPGGSVKLFTDFTSPSMVRDNIQIERFLGQELTRAVLEMEKGHFTAFVGINDMIAYGVLDELKARDKKVPDDYSVCGCDNDFPSDLVGVNLTSVEHFMSLNAQQAFRALYKKCSGEGAFSDITLIKNIQPELMPRGSTAAPPI